MKNWLFVPLLLLIHTQGQTQTQTPSDRQQILKCIQQLIDGQAQTKCGDPTSAPGILLAVKFGAEPVTAMSAGFSVPNCKNQQRLDPDMLFEIASIGKLVTATALLKFSEQGPLKIDDQMQDWVPTMSYLPSVNGQATLRQYMQHQSGVYEYNQNVVNAEPFEEWPHRLPWKNPSVVGLMAKQVGPKNSNRSPTGGYFWQPRDVLLMVQPAVVKPGTTWMYSDANYILLGMVWQSLANSSNLVPSLKKHIIEPNGLTALYLPPYQDYPLDQVAASWDQKAQVGPGQRLAYYSSSWVSGAMLSTTSDITTFVYKLLGSRQILGEPALNEMKAFIDCQPDCFIPNDADGLAWTGYGLGLIEFEVTSSRSQGKKFAMWGHGGKTAGFNSMAAYLPESDAAFTLAINQGDDEGWSNTNTLAVEIARLLALDEPCNPSR